jgi:hypothetical protein
MLIPNDPAIAPAFPVSEAPVFVIPDWQKGTLWTALFYDPAIKPMKNTVTLGNKKNP